MTVAVGSTGELGHNRADRVLLVQARDQHRHRHIGQAHSLPKTAVRPQSSYRCYDWLEVLHLDSATTGADHDDRRNASSVAMKGT